MSSIAVISLGCAKNLVDAENIMQQLYDQGHDLQEDPAGSDIVIILTCGFLQAAIEESIGVVRDILALKQAGTVHAIAVHGCLVARDFPHIRSELPDVDIWTKQGTEGVRTLMRFIAASCRNRMHAKRTQSAVVRATSPSFGYAKIADGCANCCAYCTIPAIRGPLCSKTPAQVIADVKRLTSNPLTREICLIAQDSTSYGTDLRKPVSLADLVANLADKFPDHFFRLLYLHPARVDIKLLDTISSRQNICRYLDIPLQHVSKTVLKRMGRPVDTVSAGDLFRIARERIPEVTLRTTFLVGFPGETRDDLQQLAEFINEVQPDRAGVFGFSPEPGTRAFEMGGRLAPEEVEARRLEIADILSALLTRKQTTRIGTQTLALIDATDDTQAFGRSQAEAPDVDPHIIITAPLEPGWVAPVLITGVTGVDLLAKPAT